MIYLILGQIFFSLSYIIIRFLGKNTPITYILLARYLVPVLTLASFFLFKKLKLDTHNIPILLVRSLFGILSMAFLFIAIQTGHIGTISVIYSLNMIWSFIFSHLFFKRKTNWKTISMIPICALGLGLILKPNTLFQWESANLFALGAAISVGIVSLTLQSLRKKHSSPSIVFIFHSIAALVILIPLISTSPTPPNPKTLGYLIAIGITGLIAQLSMTKGYQFVPAPIATSIDILGIPIMNVAGWVIFGQTLDPLGILGMSVVMIGLLGLVFFDKEQQQ